MRVAIQPSAVNRWNSVILSAVKNLASVAIHARFFAALRMTVFRLAQMGKLSPMRKLLLAALAGLVARRCRRLPGGSQDRRRRPPCLVAVSRRQGVVEPACVLGAHDRRPGPGQDRRQRPAGARQGPDRIPGDAGRIRRPDLGRVPPAGHGRGRSAGLAV